MTLSWCCLLVQVVFAAKLVLAADFHAAVQLDPKDIKITIESKNGEIIDCVDIYKQPSLNNPLLKDSKDQFAVAIAANGPYRGAYVLLPVWKAARLHDSESTATFLIVGGTVDTGFRPTPGRLPADVTNQIGVGFFADGGDNNPRLSVFYTPDGGKSQCYNLACGGFIQTNKDIALGASIVKGASGVDDHVPYVLVSIEKDAAGPWHVLVNDTDLGYYPRSIFPWLFPEAVANVVGGAVLNTWPGGKHTDTVMGNGRRPPGDDKTAVVKGYIAINAAGSQIVDRPTLGVRTAPDCYNFSLLGYDEDAPGINIAFGGSGGPDCAPPPA